jgi:hypothetical protein
LERRPPLSGRNVTALTSSGREKINAAEMNAIIEDIKNRGARDDHCLK